MWKKKKNKWRSRRNVASTFKEVPIKSLLTGEEKTPIQTERKRRRHGQKGGILSGGIWDMVL